ncbi:hypothetical protein C3Y89_11850 [Rhizobium sp. UPM1132]|nr:hypothetical protein [Rhizobium ruizarguesonis]
MIAVSINLRFLAICHLRCSLPAWRQKLWIRPEIFDKISNRRCGPNLTNWQRTFLKDIHAQLERSRGQARLSDKQWRKIFELLGRATGTSAVPPSPALRNPTRDQKGSRFRQRFRPRRRRLDRGLQRLAVGFLFCWRHSRWTAGSWSTPSVTLRFAINSSRHVSIRHYSDDGDSSRALKIRHSTR